MNQQFEDHFPYSVPIHKLIWNTMDTNNTSDRRKLLQWCYDHLGEESYMDNVSADLVIGEWCVTWRYVSNLEVHPVVYVRTVEHETLVKITWC